MIKNTDTRDSFLKDKKPCIIIIDMQKGFLAKDGLLPIPSPDDVIIPIKTLLNSIDEIDEIDVIWTQVSMETTSESIYRQLWPAHFSPDGEAVFNINSDHYPIVEELQGEVKPQHYVMHKEKYSAFYNTNLKQYLEDRDIEVIFFCGVVTNVCVESSVRDAYHHGFFPIVVSDCTASYSDQYKESSLEILGMLFSFIYDSGEAIKLIRSYFRKEK